MCGIVGYIGQGKKMNVGQLLLNAHFNSYRGNDGIGIIYKKGKKMIVERYLIDIEEAVTKKLDEEKTTTIEHIGSVGIKVVDTDKYDKEQIEFKKQMEKHFSQFDPIELQKVLKAVGFSIRTWSIMTEGEKEAVWLNYVLKNQFMGE